MSLAACDPSLDPMPNKSEVNNNFARLNVPGNLYGVALRTRARSDTLNCLVGGHDFCGSRSPLQSTLYALIGLHVNPFALVVPIRGFVDDIEFWKRKRVAFESVRMLTFQT